MIPQEDIFDELDFPNHSPIPLTHDENVIDIIQYISGRIHIWKDPLYLLKQKCPPNFPPKSVPVVEVQNRYLCQPFPLSKVESVSFEKSQMSNLLIDTDGRLLQLLYETKSTQEPKPGYEYIDVIEYSTPLGIFLARKPL